MALTILAADSAARPAPAPNPKLAATEAKTWLRIGPPPSPKGIMACSDGVYDSRHNVILIYGGGHADYWRNEVCAFHMASLTWKKIHEPDAQARYNNE